MRSPTHDVVVVGARCAGAATGMLLAECGHDVLVLDKSGTLGDTLSTHGIARGGVVQLSRWGLLDDVLASGAPAIRRVTFRSGIGTDERRVRDHGGVDHLIAPRRHVLDRILADAAGRAGAEVRLGESVTGVMRHADGRVAGVRVTDSDGHSREVSARMVIGADGVRSKMAGWFAAPVLERQPAETALFYSYFEGLAADGFEFGLGDGGFCGVFPTHDAQACVWVCGPVGIADAFRGGGDRIASFIQLIAGGSPSLAERLGRARPASSLRGVLRLPNHRRQAAGGGWALVGDAGYHRDPITGHGITDAFRDAEFLATAVDSLLRGEQTERAALGDYQRRRDAAIADVYRITCALSRFPAQAEFLRLQKELSRALDAEARLLADLPLRPMAIAA